MYQIFSDHNEMRGAIGDDPIQLLERRFQSYLDLSDTFLLEGKYVDKEWRDEYSIFYSTTFYEEATPFARRIHLLKNRVEKTEDIQPGSYLGNIVLRPLSVPGCGIIKATLKPEKKIFDVAHDEELYMSLCTYDFHIGGRKLKIKAFPFYTQDSMVSVCAHASMYMAAMYMNKNSALRDPLSRLSQDTQVHISEGLCPPKG